MSAFIFDFDGTLVNSLPLLKEAIDYYAPIYGYMPIDDNDIELLRGFTIKQIIQHLQVPLATLPLLIYQVKRYVSKHMATVAMATGMPSVLTALQEAGHLLGIVTSNHTRNVQLFLDAVDKQWFDFVCSESSILGKASVLKRITSKYQLNTTDAYYVGDELRDIDAAQQAGLKAVAVTWGFNNRQVLQAKQPFALIDTPNELLVLG